MDAGCLCDNPPELGVKGRGLVHLVVSKISDLFTRQQAGPLEVIQLSLDPGNIPAKVSRQLSYVKALIQPSKKQGENTYPNF